VRTVALALLVVGLLLGPGYFVYAKFFSGAAAADYPLAPRQGGFEPVAFPVAPEASPLRLVLRLSVQYGPSHDGASVPRNRYRATVTHGEVPVSERDVELVANRVESSFQEFAWDLATLQVAAPGEYRLGLEETSPPGMQVTGASVEVRRNVLDPDLRVVWAGAGLIGLAVAILVLGP
jgi:hypothetical protein